MNGQKYGDYCPYCKQKPCKCIEEFNENIKNIFKPMKKQEFIDKYSGEQLLNRTRFEVEKDLDSLLSPQQGKSAEEYLNESQSNLIGWECPRCHKIHSPYATECYCPPVIRVATSTQ